MNKFGPAEDPGKTGPADPQTPPAGPEGLGRALRSRGAQVAVSLLLTGGLLYLFLRRVEVGPLKEAIRSADIRWLWASLAIAITTFVLRAFRWTWLLRPVGRVPFWPSFLATAVGFAANNLPARVGEVIRPALLARMRCLPFSALLASILFERALDGGSALFFLLLAVLLGIPGSTAGGAAFAMMRTGALVAAAVFVLLVGAALVLLFRLDAAGCLFGRLADRLPAAWQPRAGSDAAAFTEGFASFSSPRLLATVVGSSLFM